jgi:hypothetical protein
MPIDFIIERTAGDIGFRPPILMVCSQALQSQFQVIDQV